MNFFQYVLAYQLFKSFFLYEKTFQFVYSSENQDYVFPQPFHNQIVKCLNDTDIIPRSYVKEINVWNDLFDLSNLFGLFFDFIGNKHANDGSHNTKFTFKDMLEESKLFNIVKAKELGVKISILFDYAIDTGLVVPDFCHKINGYSRSYRLSEQYELQEKHFDLIVYMYNEYQKRTQKLGLSKILTEKLLVLFFKQVIIKITNEYKYEAIEGKESKYLFGITYARFGPVVSDSIELGVSNESYLTRRLFDESRNIYKRLYQKDKKIYTIETSEENFNDLPMDWKSRARLFVKNYDVFEKILTFHDVFRSTEYIKTFDQFMIISAVGNNRDNQLLSIAAELKLFQNKMDNKNELSDVIIAMDSIIDGMVSGVWKFLCYVNLEYKKSTSLVFERVKKAEQKKEECKSKIKKHEANLLMLNDIITISQSDLKGAIMRFLTIFDQYIKYEDEHKRIVIKFNNSYVNDQDGCRKILNSAMIMLRDRIQGILISLYQNKDNIDCLFTDKDKLEELFLLQSIPYNKNKKIDEWAEKLMFDAGCILYNILSAWNSIIEIYENGGFDTKIKNTDKNVNYLNKIYNTLSKNQYYQQRLRVTSGNNNSDKIVAALKESLYEIDLLMPCINQYIMKNETRFIQISKIYIIRRDDGNDIELDKILLAKSKEKSINDFFEFSENDSYAAIIKTENSKEKIQELFQYTGYTLIDYECNRGCNTIIKIGACCFSQRVKTVVDQLLNEYKGTVIEVTDGGL